MSKKIQILTQEIDKLTSACENMLEEKKDYEERLQHMGHMNQILQNQIRMPDHPYKVNSLTADSEKININSVQ